MAVPGNVWSGRMESNVENALVKLFPVRCDLLDACLALKVPQPKCCQYRKEKKARTRIDSGDALFLCSKRE